MAVIELWLEVDAEASPYHDKHISELRVGRIRRKQPSPRVRDESGATWMQIRIHMDDMAYFADRGIIRMEVDAEDVITTW